MKPRSDRSVLYVVDALDIGGTEHHLVRILPELAEAGLRFCVYTLTHKGQLAPRLEERGIPVIEPPFAALARRLPVPVSRFAILPITSIFLLLVLFQRRPRVVHFFLPASFLVGGFASLAVPLGARVMSRRSLRDYQSRHPILVKVERWLHPRMTAVLGNSRAVLGQLRDEGIPERRLGLIRNGVDSRSFRALAPRRTLRAGLHLAEATLVLAKIANLIPYKGHADLLHALADIKDELPEKWVVLLVGAGNDEAPLRRLSATLNLGPHVRFLGQRGDVPEILGAADIGVLCSHQEGFSNSVLEGMAAGLPMVVTEVGGNPEAVVDGETGIVVKARDRAALAKAILTLATDDRKRLRMGEAGRQRAEALFSLDACVSRYRSLYEGLIEGRQGSISELIDGAAAVGDRVTPCAVSSAS